MISTAACKCEKAKNGEETEWPINWLPLSAQMDETKMDYGVGAGVYSEELGVALSLRLVKHTSILQAEVLGIFEACKS